MGFFFEGYTVATVLGFLALTAVLVVLNELTRRSKIFSILIYCVPARSAGGTDRYGCGRQPLQQNMVRRNKDLLRPCRCYRIYADPLYQAGQQKFAWYFPVAILGINILEAIYRDYEVFANFKTMTVDAAGIVQLGGPWNLMNALAGVFLLLTMTGWVGIKVANTKSRDMVWADQLWFWIIAYDLWNMAYCYNCISTRAMYAGFALLVSCTVAEFFIKRGIWLQHRAQTLALFGMFSLAVDYQAMPVFSITATYNPTAWTVLSALALIVNAAVFVYEVCIIVKTKRNPLKKEMFTHLPAYRKNLEANGLRAE